VVNTPIAANSGISRDRKEDTVMHPALHSHNRQEPGRRPEPGPAPGSADLTYRQVEKLVSWTGRERLRCLWYHLRLTVAEMNYATRRVVKVQAPWISDGRPRH
jgi:hypothetical protein